MDLRPTSLDHDRARPLRPGERQIVEAMLYGKCSRDDLVSTLDTCLVEDMQDGGMGSIRFLSMSQTRPRFGRAIAEAEYTDEDGALVSITVNVDGGGKLFELDVWKVDFSPLRRYPTPAELRITP